jgi:NosR/NirI family transcriptional regulator, nitrous oxide reductase regulator
MMRIIHAAAALACAAALTGCPAAGFVPAESYLSDVDVSMPPIAGLPDGTYAARASVALPAGAVAMLPWAEAEVAVAGGAIETVRMTAPTRYPEIMARPQDFEALAARVVAAQSTDVDIVSGATFTSTAFLKAIAKAVSR